jgi:hypothetical protein
MQMSLVRLAGYAMASNLKMMQIVTRSALEFPAMSLRNMEAAISQVQAAADSRSGRGPVVEKPAHRNSPAAPGVTAKPKKTAKSAAVKTARAAAAAKPKPVAKSVSKPVRKPVRGPVGRKAAVTTAPARRPGTAKHTSEALTVEKAQSDAAKSAVRSAPIAEAKPAPASTPKPKAASVSAARQPAQATAKPAALKRPRSPSTPPAMPEGTSGTPAKPKPKK